MDKDGIIDEIVDFVSQYTEIMDVELRILNNEVNIEIEIVNSNFNYVNVARMLSKILKTRYMNYKFIVNMIPVSSKVFPILREYGLRAEIMKKIHGISFDSIFRSFIMGMSEENLKKRSFFFRHPFKLPEIINDFLTEEEVCNDYIDFFNEAYIYTKDDKLIDNAKIMESMVRFNLIKLYGSKIFRMGTLFLVKLWRFNYDIILQNSYINFSPTIKDKSKFSDFLNSLSLTSYSDPSFISIFDKNEIKYYPIKGNIIIELLVGAATYLEAVATSMVQTLILHKPTEFYNYFLKRFAGFYSADRLILPYYLTLGGGVVFDNLVFTHIKDSSLGKFKIDRSELKVNYTGDQDKYIQDLDMAYVQMISKAEGDSFNDNGHNQ